MADDRGYQAVIGLEVHIQLLTNTKAFSAEPTSYGEIPNTRVGPITLALPGTLPRPNEAVIEFGVRLALALGCTLTERNEFARKNYFYADLPKGYQITQDKTPLATGGGLSIRLKNGQKKFINLIRIHMEEDAGKSIHDQDPDDTLIDLNRAGTPLLEMVSAPDIRSGEEAYQYLTEVRKLVRNLRFCDGNMEEGSLRGDANISVMKKGADKYGTRVEVKNMNSIRNVQRAIEYEIERQIDLIEKGIPFTQETRSFDAVSGTTFSLRSKEAANDYRYFPEPDIQPVILTKDFIQKVESTLPPLPQALFEKYVKDFQLSEYDAGVLTESREFSEYFEELSLFCPNKKAAANWAMGPIKSYLNERAVSITDFPLSAAQMAKLVNIVDEGKVSFSMASQELFPKLVESPGNDPLELAGKLNLIQTSDTGQLQDLVKQALDAFPEKITEYNKGKNSLIGVFMGEVRKLRKGKADQKIDSKLLKETLDKL